MCPYDRHQESWWSAAITCEIWFRFLPLHFPSLHNLRLDWLANRDRGLRVRRWVLDRFPGSVIEWTSSHPHLNELDCREFNEAAPQNVSIQLISVPWGTSLFVTMPFTSSMYLSGRYTAGSYEHTMDHKSHKRWNCKLHLPSFLGVFGSRDSKCYLITRTLLIFIENI